MGFSSLLVFDIETVPDVDACRNLMGFEAGDRISGQEALENYHLEITDGRNPFLRQLFHKVVAISFVEVGISSDGDYQHFTLKEVRSGGESGYSEQELLRGFFSFFARKQPRLVSFNGRTFDLPVLKYRAMVHGIPCKYLYSSGDKWNNYLNRYSSDWHCDLLEALSDFGASASVKLSEVCAAFGLPGKVGTVGADVARLFNEGQVERIRNYCETDVLNTYLIYLRMMMHQGKIKLSGYNKAIEDLIMYLNREGEQREHLLEFYSAWEGACSGDFFIKQGSSDEE